MKQFINKDMLAPNVLTAPVDPGIVDRFRPLAEGPLDRSRFADVHPPWASDIRWVSPLTEEGFEPFDTAFRELGVESLVRDYVDVDQAVRLFAGFVVVRSRCDAPDFHCDWLGANNEGFTLLAPIAAGTECFGLLYERLDGTTATYEYRRGEAIVFGDHFSHSTMPGQSDSPVALLCFNFGTDKMEHWPKLRRTAAYQGELVRRPDGSFERPNAAHIAG